MGQPELKPCPFCGGEAWVTVWRNAELKPMYNISCPNEECHIQPYTDYDVDKETLVKQWNKRANDGGAVNRAAKAKEVALRANEEAEKRQPL